jgi:alcohol dehydrogenase
MVAAAEAAMLLPEALAYVDAAPILGAGNTVWGGLKRAAPQPAQTVAVVGIGGLGHLAVQYARVAGFRTIAVSRTRAKDEFIREELKADAVARDGDDLARLGGADVVLATGTSTEAMIDGMCGMRPDSTLVVMGYEVKPLAIPMGDLIMKRIRIVGSRQNTREDLYEALQIVARGSVKVFTERFAFEDVLTVYDRVVAGDIRYRAVLEF